MKDYGAASYGTSQRFVRSNDSMDAEINAKSSSSSSTKKRYETHVPRKTCLSPGVFTVVCGIITLFTLTIFVVEKKQFNKQYNNIRQNVQWLQLFGEDQTMYTMRRSGYHPLFYFDPATASSYLKYKVLDGYVGIVEPYVPNELYIYDQSTDSAASYYEYQLCNVNDATDCTEGVTVSSTSSSSSSSSKTTVSVVLECSAYDVYNLVVIKRSTDSDAVTETSQGQVLCMNVRREMRELSYSDLQLTMDTMKVLWEVDDATGAAKFGDSYKSANYLLEFHFYNAAWQTGDHIHEGLGFVPQHMKLTNIFENSLRAVNPAVALPFWDFTIDTAAGLSVWDSFAFQADTFGSLSAPPDEFWGWTYQSANVDSGKIPDGRWAGATTGINEKFPDMRSAYGNMRAPWSMNPSKYITRFTSADKTLPTCASHYQLLEYKTFQEFLHWSPYAPHGSTHGSIGGIFGCDALDSMTERGYLRDQEGQRDLCKNWIFYLKELYRAGTLSPRKECAMNAKDTSLSSCGFECNTKLKGEMKKMLYMILNSDYEVTPMPLKFDDMEAWVEFVCDGDGYKVFAGDHLESASAADPSFWPIHPTLDRLLQAKFMSGGWETASVWPEDVFDKTNYLCDKASCFHSSMNALALDDACCYGHHLSDQMLSYDAATGQTLYVGPTNEEVLVMGDPTSDTYAMPYIYSSFAWSHCDDPTLAAATDVNYLLDNMAYTNLEDPSGAYTVTGKTASKTSSVSSYNTYSKWFSSVTTYTKPEPAPVPVAVVTAPAVAQAQSPVVVSPVSDSAPMASSASASATTVSEQPQPVDTTTTATAAAAAANSETKSVAAPADVATSPTSPDASEKKSLWHTFVAWLLSPFSPSMQATDVTTTSTTATAQAEPVPVPGVKTGVNPALADAAVDAPLPDVVLAVDSVKVRPTSDTDADADTEAGTSTEEVAAAEEGGSAANIDYVFPDVIAAVDSIKVKTTTVTTDAADAVMTSTAPVPAAPVAATAAAATTTVASAPAVPAAAVSVPVVALAPLPDAGVKDASVNIGTTPVPVRPNNAAKTSSTTPSSITSSTITQQAATASAAGVATTTSSTTTSTVTPAATSNAVAQEKVVEVTSKISLKLGTITSSANTAVKARGETASNTNSNTNTHTTDTDSTSTTTSSRKSRRKLQQPPSLDETVSSSNSNLRQRR